VQPGSTKLQQPDGSDLLANRAAHSRTGTTSKERAAYGKGQLQVLSNQLKTEFGKGFDSSNLRNMRRFYLVFSIWETVSLKLSWSHYNVRAQLENDKARQWYLKEAVEQSWSVRALDRQVGVMYYERPLSSSNRPVVEQEARDKTAPLINNKDYLRDPYILDFLNLPSQTLLENDIEQAIISNLQTFLLELGKGFSFVERQQRISTEDQDFFLDLLFYNHKLKNAFY
jgi:predicted nuclease of restriction endonuclease-like (RecB) superfamily